MRLIVAALGCLQRVEVVLRVSDVCAAPIGVLEVSSTRQAFVCSNFEAMLVFAECCLPVIRALDFLEREIKISGSRVSVWMWLD